MALLTTGLTFKTMAANVGKAMGNLELLTFTLLVRGKGIHSFILKSSSAFVNHNLVINRSSHTSVATRGNLAQVPKEGDIEFLS